MQLVPSTIDAVTVHRRGARVRRRIALSSAKPGLVRLAPLPLAIDDDSVRVSGSGHVNDLRVVLTTVSAQADLPPPEDAELEAARVAQAKASARVEAHKRALQSLDQLTLAPRRYTDEGPQSIPTDQRLALVSFRRDRSDALTRELRDLREALRKAREQVTDLEERQRLASTVRQTRANEIRKGVDLTLDSTEGELFLEYTVPGARWTPSYVLRFDDALTQARLEMRAFVAQRSGEDWRDVQLTLSTAVLDRWTDLPELSSIRIGRKQQRPTRAGWREAPQGAASLYADFDRAFPVEAERPVKPPSRPKPTAPRQTAAPPPPAPLGAMVSGGAPPGAAPPMSASAPMPMSAPMPAAAAPPPQAMARSRSRGMSFGSIGGKQKKKSRDKETTATFDTSALSSVEVEGGAAELEADVNMMAYGRLRLPGVRSTTRGRLRLVARTELYLEVLRTERGAVDVDLATLASYEKRAHKIESMPDQCFAPTADDGFDYAYAATHPIDVPSDGSFHSLSITEGEDDAEGRFVVVPRESSDVFRFVELGNPLIGPILRGPADVYVGDRYLLTRSMKVTPKGGRLKLGLGVEEGIKVARNARFEERSAGLMGRALELVHDIDIDVVNHLAKRARVEVRERIPAVHKGDDEIEIREESVSPSWESWEPDTQKLQGGRRWLIDVDSGEEKQLRASYVIRISAKKELVGGNRREG